MRQGLTTTTRPRLPQADRGALGQKNGSGQIGIMTWMDAPLLILSMSLLSLSVFSGPLVSAYHLVILLAIGAGVLYTTSASGTATERIGQQRVALFLVVLMNIYLISLTNGWPASIVYGRTLQELGSLIALTVFALWVIRVVQRRAFTLIRTPLDLAVLMLCLVTVACFLGLHVLLFLSGHPSELEHNILWVVLLTALLHYIFGDLLHTESAIGRMLLLLLFPLAVAVLSTIALWLAVIGISIVTYSHSAGLVEPRQRERYSGRA